MPAGSSWNSRLILIAFNLKRCQKNKEAPTSVGRRNATVYGDYLSLVRLRTELHEMAPDAGPGVSKQIVRTKRLEIANSTPTRFVRGLQFAHLHSSLLTLFKEVAARGDFLCESFLNDSWKFICNSYNIFCTSFPWRFILFYTSQIPSFLILARTTQLNW